MAGKVKSKSFHFIQNFCTFIWTFPCIDKSGELYQIDGSFNRFQLRLNQNLYEEKETLLNTDVRVKGKVETGVTGHQHTKLLIYVTDIQSAASTFKSSKIASKAYSHLDYEVLGGVFQT